ncbi:DUF6603 domain-containing protein [Asanoa ferruginea]|nr:DUF6603 domain-containing protein [Asanoa ferruginea]
MDQYRITILAVDFIAPLAEATTSPAAEARLLRALGFAPPDGFTLLSGLAPAVEGLVGAAIDLVGTDPDADESEWLGKFAAVTAALVEAVVAAQQFAAGLPAGTLNSPFVTGSNVLDELPARLANHLVVSFLERRLPAAYAILVVTGIIEVALEAPTGPYVTAFTRRTMRWDRIPTVLSDPLGALRERYAWAAPSGVDVDLLVRDLRLLMAGFGLRAELLSVDKRARAAIDLALAGNGRVPVAPDTLVLRAPLLPLEPSPLGLEVYPVVDQAGTADGFGVAAYLDANATIVFELSPTLRAELTVGGYTSGFGVVLRRGQDPRLTTPMLGTTPASILDGVELDVGLALVAERQGAPLIPLGTAGSTHLEFGSITARFDVGKPISGPADFGVALEIAKGALVLKAGDGDGFISKIFGEGFILSFDITVGFSTERGLYFEGAGGIEFEIPIHEDLFGILLIDSVFVALRLETTGIAAVVAATATVSLGPVVATVERIGLKVEYPLPTADELHANGPTLSFKPPNGAGLVIDAGPVVGGGYLMIDSDNGRYAGILQLAIQGTLSITAIGLIVTKMPSGRQGFSAVIILTAEFPPIQLSFGFVLTGLGGLLGANRSMNVQAMRDGVRNRGLDSVLFPRDPVANAPKVIRDLESFFPIVEGQFVIGLMAAVGWGSPPLIKVELGILIELPSPIRIALLGRLTAALPTEDAAVVLLHVDVLGILDFAASELSIDATLYDSRVAIFTLTGDFAVRLNFGAAPAFAFSCGGFNPRFTPPAGFPTLRRVSIALATSENPRIRLEAYLAATPTSVQMGAKLDLYVEADLGFLGLFSASVYLGFDALVYLVPRFSFIVDLSGGVVIKRNGSPLLSATVALTLTGPEPFTAAGYAELDFFGKHRIAFEATIGEERPQPALEAGDPIGDLLAALGLPGAWRAALPPAGGTLVTLREPDESELDDLLLHPFGVVAVSQRIAPLDVPLDRYGGAAVPPQARTLSLAVTIGGAAATGDQVRDPFPCGQFFDLTDEARVTGEAFPRLPSGLSGIRVPAAAPVAAGEVTGGEGYETAVVNPASWRPLPAPGGYTFTAEVLDVLVHAGAAGRARDTGFAGPSLGIAVAEKSYVAGGATYASVVEAAASRQPVVGAHETVAP